MMVVLLVLSVLLWVGYCCRVVCLGGVPSSLSSTYYTRFGRRWFVVLLLCVSGLLLYPSLALARDGTEMWAFVSVCGLLFVGFSPLSRDVFEGRVHLGAALVTAIGTQGFVLWNCPWCLCLWVLLPLILLDRGRAVFWSEMLCFVCYVGALFAAL